MGGVIMGWTFYNASGQRLQAFGFVAATQAEMEAGSSTTAYVTPGRTQHHPGVAKAWCQVTYSTGTPTLTSPDYGVASIADTALGRLKVTWSTAFSSGVYSTPGMASATNGGNILSFGGGDGQQTGYTEINMYNDFATGYEDANVEIAAFGDQ
jgi:hypothetical protein